MAVANKTMAAYRKKMLKSCALFLGEIVRVELIQKKEAFAFRLLSIFMKEADLPFGNIYLKFDTGKGIRTIAFQDILSIEKEE